METRQKGRTSVFTRRRNWWALSPLAGLILGGALGTLIGYELSDPGGESYFAPSLGRLPGAGVGGFLGLLLGLVVGLVVSVWHDPYR